MTSKREEVNYKLKRQLIETIFVAYDLKRPVGISLAEWIADALLERFDIQPYCDCERPDVACTDRIVQKIHEMVCVTCGRIGRARGEGRK